MRLYGKLALRHKDGLDTWELDVEPHVALRLKRVLARISRKRVGKLWFTATPETSRDLTWILSRYPVEISESDAVYLQDQANTYDRNAERMHSVLSGKASPRAFELAIPLRNYQAQAAEAALQRPGMLIADDVGLGKTAIGIAIAATVPDLRPMLVVTLTHLTQQWQREFTKFAPQLHTHIAKKGTPYPMIRTARARRVGPNALCEREPDVLIMNYAKLAGWAPALVGKVRAVVFDECQELRRSGSHRYDAAEAVSSRATFRLGLSATPIYNYGGEFHTVMECLRPGILGTWSEFTTEWCTDSWDKRKASVKDPRAFGSYLRDEGLMLRRTREEVGRELPAVSIIPHHVDCDLDILTEGDDVVAELCKIVLAGGEVLERGERMRAAGDLDWRLRQQTGLAKAVYVARFVDLLCESGEQVVLYGWHHACYDVWREELKHWDPVFFTGQESAPQKERAREAFLSGDSKVLCMSLRAGAGLDGLQESCAVVVFAELDWSPQVHHQCVGRVHRDGQKRRVVAYYLVADEGSDPVISDVLGIKRHQSEAVLDPDAPLAQPAQIEDRIRKLAEDYAERHGIRLPSNVIDLEEAREKRAGSHD